MTARKNPVAHQIRKRALSYPEVVEDHPWGESAFKVKGKVFVFMHDSADELSLSVKLSEGREFALSLPRSEPTRYGLGAKGWVTVRPTTKTKVEPLFALIDESYRLIAPKRVVQQLDESRKR
ncbi:MAG TPA: MmcQ/YjbR family DNA-binding protein [Thermoanaerobaculia bacterium]|nr:MmcQ/YjbR family DNA-binding protein [Thermoanaerobaculia bacterium]